MNTYRLSPKELPWTPSEQAGVFVRELFASNRADLSEFKADGQATWGAPPRSLVLISEGAVTTTGGDRCSPGDLYWCNQHNGELQAGQEGARWYCIEPRQAIGSELVSQIIRSAEIPWENFDDPAGRPTQPVQILLDGTLSALRTRFDPEYIAGEHWHDFDTLYFISAGTMQFGDEGWFKQGQVRAVHGGHSYGPERPGTDGVEFVLISLGGPVALHWSDLEPPPP